MNKFLIALFFSSFTVFAQQTDVVDFLSIRAYFEADNPSKSVNGDFDIDFKILKKTDSIYLDAVNAEIYKIDHDNFKITASEKKIWIVGNFEVEKDYTIGFSYKMNPTQGLYYFDDQIWTQGQGKYTSNWLPSIDDVNDKIKFNLTIVAPLGKTIISNGKFSEFERLDKTFWSSFHMKNPMSSYLVAFAIGDFSKKELVSNSGIPIELYYKTSDSLKVEPTYRYSKQLFDFLETEIGVAYPWQNYKQVPVRDFLYAGMENTTATFFSEAFVVDSIGFNDRNYINV